MMERKTFVRKTFDRLENGASITCDFVIYNVEQRITKDGRKYINLFLQKTKPEYEKSFELINCKYWNKDISSFEFKKGDFVQIKGKMSVRQWEGREVRDLHLETINKSLIAPEQVGTNQINESNTEDRTEEYRQIAESKEIDYFSVKMYHEDEDIDDMFPDEESFDDWLENHERD